MANLALAFDILARDKGASRTLKDVGDTAEHTGRQGESAGRRLGVGLKAGAFAAAAGAVALTAAMGRFVAEAKESQRIGRLTEAVVKSTGGVANVSADQVGRLATAMSNKTAMDDEAVQNGLNVLLTFTRVRNEVGKGNDIFNQGAEAAANLSAALGTDLQAANLLVGKALNDPIKGMTALTRAGIQFTDQQKDQIRTMVESGDLLGAQKIILGELGTQFGGAAEAAASPLDRLRVVGDNLSEQLGGLLLPTVERFADYVSDRVAPAIARFIEGFQNGEGAGGRMRDMFAAVGERAVQFGRFIGDEVYPRLVTFAGFVRDEVIPRVMRFGQMVATDVVPRLASLREWFQTRVLPAMRVVGEYLDKTFRPTWNALVALWRDSLEPGARRIQKAFQDNRPALEMVAKAVGVVMAAAGALVTTIAGMLLPILVKVAGFMVNNFVRQFELGTKAVTVIVDAVKLMVDQVRIARDWIKRMVDKLDGIRVPQALREIKSIVESIGGWVDRAAGGVGRFFGQGDAPANFRGMLLGGGPALARVQRVLPAGLTITSTYRSPEHNRRVGGSPTSLHMDRDNPAVDIAGPTYLLDQFAATLAAMGGWRQLLWRVSGHFDHIHVAHSGGTVSSAWPRLPGDRYDERTVRTQVGERIIPRGQAIATAGGGDTYIVDGLVLAGADLPPEVAEFFRSIKRRARMAGVKR